MTKEEICTRIKVSYEQLSKCHSDLCRSDLYGSDSELMNMMLDSLNDLLNIQVKLGMLKREEDII